MSALCIKLSCIEIIEIARKGDYASPFLIAAQMHCSVHLCAICRVIG